MVDVLGLPRAAGAARDFMSVCATLRHLETAVMITLESKSGRLPRLQVAVPTDIGNGQGPAIRGHIEVAIPAVGQLYGFGELQGYLPAANGGVRRW